MYENGQEVPLTEITQVTSGTVINALRGVITVTAASGLKGKTVNITVGGAVFKLAQTGAGPNKGQLTFNLVENLPGAPSLAVCRTGHAPDRNAHASRLSSRVLQTLHASERGGRYRTVGRYAAATVRGTAWDTTDRCDGTLIGVHRGAVAVTDLVHHKTINLHAGQHYLAKAH